MKVLATIDAATAARNGFSQCGIQVIEIQTGGWTPEERECFAGLLTAGDAYGDWSKKVISGHDADAMIRAGSDSGGTWEHPASLSAPGPDGVREYVRALIVSRAEYAAKKAIEAAESAAREAARQAERAAEEAIRVRREAEIIAAMDADESLTYGVYYTSRREISVHGAPMAVSPYTFERIQERNATADARKKAAQEALDAARTLRRNAWIGEHGSTKIRANLAHGMTCPETYRREWTALAGYDSPHDWAGEIPRETQPLKCAREQQLEIFDAILTEHPDARLAWLPGEPLLCEDGCTDEEGEPISTEMRACEHSLRREPGKVVAVRTAYDPQSAEGDRRDGDAVTLYRTL